MIDSRDIKHLHPCLQRAASELIRRMKEQGYPVLITSTYRDNEAQNALYAQGRTKPGSKVTNAKGGQSIHNYRLAFDICKNIKGQEYSDAKFFNTAGKIWTEMGGVWGGNWTSFVDRPHMEFTNGLTVSRLKSGSTLAQTVKMKWETVAALKPTSTKAKEDDEVIGEMKVQYEGKETTVAAILKDNSYYASVRELCELLGIKPEWDSAKRIVKIAR